MKPIKKTKIIASIWPSTRTEEKIIELYKAVDDIEFSDLVFAVKKYIKKNISDTHTYLGVNYVNRNTIEVIVSILDHNLSRHGYGDSHEIITKFLLDIKELGF